MKIKGHNVQNRKITSIFFGGGTPSLFSEDSIRQILDNINIEINRVNKVTKLKSKNKQNVALSYYGLRQLFLGSGRRLGT